MTLPIATYLALSSMEELGFRGYALRTLDAQFGVWPALALAAIADRRARGGEPRQLGIRREGHAGAVHDDGSCVGVGELGECRAGEWGGGHLRGRGGVLELVSVAVGGERPDRPVDGALANPT